MKCSLVVIPALLTVAALGAAETGAAAESLPGEDAATAAASDTAAGSWRSETASQREERLCWWKEARFGLFIHWGVYAIDGGLRDGKKYNSEWMFAHAKIPVAEYRAKAKGFVPTKFDAEAWVRLAKQAGQRYIVITTKHHDGFALWPTKVSDWNLQQVTPFARDPLAELAVACRREGIRLGFYYSQGQDWMHPGGGFVTSAKGPWDPAQRGDFDTYLDRIAIPQIKELMTSYGPDVPALFWFDTPTGNMRPERVERVLGVLRTRSDLIINNRLRYGGPGDFSTPERRIPTTGFPDGRLWETCEMMNEHWGYAAYDRKWKSSALLVRRLVESVSKGGNYLLNVGPTPEGEIPQASVDRLQDLGRWLRTHGEAIYGAGPGPFPRPGAWRCTARPGRLFIHLWEWPKDVLVLPALPSPAKSVALLGETGPQPLRGTAVGAEFHIQLPPQAPDSLLPVVAIDL